jgi:hypothetical protein
VQEIDLDESVVNWVRRVAGYSEGDGSPADHDEVGVDNVERRSVGQMDTEVDERFSVCPLQ